MAFARAQLPVAATRASKDLTDVLLIVSVVFVPAIAAGTVVIVVNKEVHIMVQIVEERAQLRTAALCSAESASVGSVIKLVVPSGLILVMPLSLIVAALIRRRSF